MVIKFSDTSTTTMITVRCDLCTKIVYSTTKDIQDDHQKHPYICETYKVYCERCYMTPLLKIKELVTMLEQYEIKEEKKTKRRAKRVEKEKTRFDELSNEFY
jgi:hypothetical protein